ACSTRAGSSSDASRPRAPSMRPGAWRSLPPTSPPPAAICWSGTSGTGRSTRTSIARMGIGSSEARLGAVTVRRSSSTGCGGSPSATAELRGRRTPSTSPPDRETSRRATSEASRRRRNRGRRDARRRDGARPGLPVSWPDARPACRRRHPTGKGAPGMADVEIPDALRDNLRAAWHRYIDMLVPLRPDLHRYCRRLAGNLWDAEDLAQDTLVRAFGRWGLTYPEIREPRAYLLRTATNLWIDTLRRRDMESLAQPLHPEQLPAPGTNPETASAVRDPSRRLLQALSPQERAAPVLKEVFDMTLEEI